MSDDEFDIWLIWAMDERGLANLREVCTSESRVKIAVRMCKDDKRLVRYHVEKTKANHHFGSSLKLKGS